MLEEVTYLARIFATKIRTRNVVVVIEPTRIIAISTRVISKITRAIARVMKITMKLSEILGVVTTIIVLRCPFAIATIVLKLGRSIELRSIGLWKRKVWWCREEMALRLSYKCLERLLNIRDSAFFFLRFMNNSLLINRPCNSSNVVEEILSIIESTKDSYSLDKSLRMITMSS